MLVKEGTAFVELARAANNDPEEIKLKVDNLTNHI